MMYRLVLQKSVTVTGVRWCNHITRVSSDRVWISDIYNNLILTNTAGDKLHLLKDIASLWGGHTVNNDGDLIYIDSVYNINKLSTENKVKTTLIKYTAPWIPVSVYSSPSTGDLLVGMYNDDTDREGKLVRYNSTGEHIQTIQYDNNTGQGLYRSPTYITENRNGDVIVSDLEHDAVVVTDRGGSHRFSYTGHPSGSRLRPCGICTNALSHILVCDYYTKSVQMLDSNGNFLSQIQTSPHGINRPGGLSYDDTTQLLWVGSLNNTVNIYRVVDTDSLTGLPLEDIKCKKHPRSPLNQFCTPCGVPLCVECTSSEDHSRHDLRNIEDLFHNIRRIKDGDTLLMSLLLSNSYKINMKEGNWMNKYNAVAKSFHSKKITKPFALTDLEKYKPILKLNESEISFSNELFKDISFLKFSKSFGLNFTDIFLTWAEKENVAEYCRSWNYPRRENEVCCWLLPEKTEELLQRLGEDIFTHSTMNDQSFHEAVFRKLGIPIQIILRGDKSVKNFIENLKKGKTTMYHASGMIIGCAGSGKTTLLERLKGIDLEEIKKNVSSTRGVHIHTDIFDVTDSIQANSSSQQQRFKLRLDKNDLKQSVPEYHAAENAADDGEMQEKMEPVDDEGNTTEASNSGQISHDDTDIKTTSSYEPQGATSPENLVEVMKESKDIPHSSEISGNLQIEAENISEDPDKKITMTDFAGQCAYYASHQIFLSPRAFFILVLNMEMNFDDKVGEEVCCQEGSIYRGWTHRDYLEFWMKSIHQYSSDKAPVILVGTHSENKTEKEKKLFFREVWKTLDMNKKSLHKHIDVKRRFAVGFQDNESIEKLKLSIADVVCRLDHWGEELPQSWAMFETFFREKKIHKILSRGDLQSFIETLPEGIKLHTIKDVDAMLQFFHDIREIIHFNQQFLNEVIILDVQWFADAFKNIITDKNHATEDLFEFASEWDKFDKTGELDETLLSALWRMNNNDYIEHKEDIMMYMEKLGLLAKMSDKKWYVPCMNKMQFPVNNFSSYPASSILCYTFDVLPVENFHRLVATCMQIPHWDIFSDEERGCIYQTAAIFVFHDQHHNIMLGMTQTEIQLQVFVVEGDIDVSNCHQIRENIDRILLNLSNTFQKNSEFQVAFKCKSTGFCDSKESAVISESKFIRDNFLCPSCPANRKHCINTEDITKYWKQTKPSNSSTSMASGQDLGGRSRFAKLGMATNDVLNEAYRDILKSEVPPSDIENKVNSLSNKERKNLKLNPDQEGLLKRAKNTGYKEFDISLTYKMIRNICSTIQKPTKGKWGQEPAAGEVTVGDDIERIRFIRNRLAAHVSSASTPQTEFDDTWSTMSDICQRLETFTGKKYLDNLNDIKILTLKREVKDVIIQKLYMEHQEMLKTLMSDMQEVKSDVKDIKTAVLKPESTGAMNDS
ncbi:uncharacterized protein LOC133202269 [Saccostrea echinata]|uniref:uncharacterized protein LOC133202269 n=1 Tax=Saccostrea echinata TaxID=191078 RepID=UPI002A8299EE|nr:uncharacterized protein LOC133202269 [Saccostrea echinata]